MERGRIRGAGWTSPTLPQKSERRRSGGSAGQPVGAGGRGQGGPAQQPPATGGARGAGRSAMSAEDAGSGPGPAPEPGPLCPEHGQALSWFCCSERRPVCAACAGPGGRCRGHRIRRAEERAEELRVSGRGPRKAGGSGRRGLRREWGAGSRAGQDPVGPGSLRPGGRRGRSRNLGFAVALAVEKKG